MKSLVVGFSLLLCAALLFAGCTTTLERADKFYAAGAYDEAVRTYEEAVREDASDERAAIGLRAARLKWIDTKLLQARMLRLAGNTEQSVNLLLEVLRKENTWNIFPTGAVAFTQEEELGQAARTIKHDLDTLLKKNLPLAAAAQMEKFRLFFQAERSKTGEDFTKRIYTSGQAQCRDMKSSLSSDDYYYGLFVQKFCMYFGEAQPELKAQIKRRIGSLYHDVVLELQDGALDPSYAAMFEEAARRALIKSAWYDPLGARVLVLKGRAKYLSEHKVENKTLTHSYSISVPYTETRTEKKPKSDTRSVNVEALGLISGGTTRKEVEDEYITITETKYRNEPRAFDYPAMIHRQKFTLDLTAEGEIDNEKLKFSLSDNLDHQTVEHHNNMEEMGLYPQKPSLKTDGEWLQSQAEVFKTQLENKSFQLWRNRYCRDGSAQRTNRYAAEFVFRCLRAGGANDVPQNYSNWFKERLGISVSQAALLIGQI